MHDIICPLCGERTLARSVGYDLSEHLLPLLPPMPEAVPDLRFLFVADEELLFPDGLPAPGVFVPFSVDADLLRCYINRRTGKSTDLMFGELFDAHKCGQPTTAYPALLYTWLEEVTASCFTLAGKPPRPGSIREEERHAVADLLCGLYGDAAAGTGHLTFLLSPALAPDGVPEGLRCTLGSSTGTKMTARCCPRCGFRFPHGCGHHRERLVLAAADNDKDAQHLLGLVCAGARTDPAASILHCTDNLCMILASDRLYVICAPDGAHDTVGYLMDNSRLLPEVDHLLYLFDNRETGESCLPEHLCTLTEAIRMDRRGKSGPDSLTFLTPALPLADPAPLRNSAGEWNPEAFRALAQSNREAICRTLPYLGNRLVRAYAGADRMLLSCGAPEKSEVEAAQAGRLLWLRLLYADKGI